MDFPKVTKICENAGTLKYTGNKKIIVFHTSIQLFSIHAFEEK